MAELLLTVGRALLQFLFLSLVAVVLFCFLLKKKKKTGSTITLLSLHFIGKKDQNFVFFVSSSNCSFFFSTFPSQVSRSRSFPHHTPIIICYVLFHDARFPGRFIFLKSNARVTLQVQEKLVSRLPVKFMYNYVIIVLAGYWAWATQELCKNIQNFTMETKAKKTVFHHVKDQIDCLWAKFQNTCDQEKKVISLLN